MFVVVGILVNSTRSNVREKPRYRPATAVGLPMSGVTSGSYETLQEISAQAKRDLAFGDVEDQFNTNFNHPRSASNLVRTNSLDNSRRKSYISAVSSPPSSPAQRNSYHPHLDDILRMPPPKCQHFRSNSHTAASSDFGGAASLPGSVTNSPSKPKNPPPPPPSSNKMAQRPLPPPPTSASSQTSISDIAAESNLFKEPVTLPPTLRGLVDGNQIAGISSLKRNRRPRDLEIDIR